MNKTLREIEFTFENIESYRIPAEDIAMLSVSGIERNICTNWDSQITFDHETCDFFFVILKESANRHKEQRYGEGVGICERLTMYRDLVSVGLYYKEDLKGEEIYVNWKGDPLTGDCNEYQQVEWDTEHKYLVVQIGESEESVTEYINKYGRYFP